MKNGYACSWMHSRDLRKVDEALFEFPYRFDGGLEEYVRSLRSSLPKEIAFETSRTGNIIREIVYGKISIYYTYYSEDIDECRKAAKDELHAFLILHR